jgi:GTPase SAR1 family protein
MQRLNEALTRKLTLIAAPAGSGKTTLVSQWLRRMKARSEAEGVKERMKAEGVKDESKMLSFILHPSSFILSSGLGFLDEGDNDPVAFGPISSPRWKGFRTVWGPVRCRSLHSLSHRPWRWS